MRLIWRVAALALFSATWLSEAALACPVCFQSTEENRLAFIGTTAFMTFFPLFMLAGLGYWFRLKYLEAEAAQQAPALRVIEGNVEA